MCLDCVSSITVFKKLHLFWNADGMHSKWNILGKIILRDNNLAIINTKKIFIYHGVDYSLTMILVFKQIYNTFFLKKTMNVIMQRHRKCG